MFSREVLLRIPPLRQLPTAERNVFFVRKGLSSVAWPQTSRLVAQYSDPVLRPASTQSDRVTQVALVIVVQIARLYPIPIWSDRNKLVFDRHDTIGSTKALYCIKEIS